MPALPAVSKWRRIQSAEGASSDRIGRKAYRFDRKNQSPERATRKHRKKYLRNHSINEGWQNKFVIARSFAYDATAEYAATKQSIFSKSKFDVW
jgi:hypothetical protein